MDGIGCFSKCFHELGEAARNAAWSQGSSEKCFTAAAAAASEAVAQSGGVHLMMDAIRRTQRPSEAIRGSEHPT